MVFLRRVGLSVPFSPPFTSSVAGVVDRGGGGGDDDEDFS